jgi:hypothetical protein
MKGTSRKMNPENWKRDQRLLGFRYWAFRMWIWAAKTTLLFLVYERLDFESPNTLHSHAHTLGYPYHRETTEGSNAVAGR